MSLNIKIFYDRGDTFFYDPPFKIIGDIDRQKTLHAFEERVRSMLFDKYKNRLPSIRFDDGEDMAVFTTPYDISGEFDFAVTDIMAQVYETADIWKPVPGGRVIA